MYIYAVTLTSASFYGNKNDCLRKSSLNKGRNFNVLRLLRRLTLSFHRTEMRQNMGKYLFTVMVARYLCLHLFIRIFSFTEELVKLVLFHWGNDQSASENFSKGIWKQRRKSCSPSVKGITVTELNRARFSPTLLFFGRNNSKLSHLGPFIFLLDGFVVFLFCF